MLLSLLVYDLSYETILSHIEGKYGVYSIISYILDPETYRKIRVGSLLGEHFGAR